VRRNSVIERWSLSDNREDWSFEDVRGHLVAFATDSAGTHFLQKLFDIGTDHDIRATFREFDESIPMLLTHKCGNWTLKKLVSVASAAELSTFVEDHVLGSTTSLSYHVNSARVLKSAMIQARSLRQAMLSSRHGGSTSGPDVARLVSAAMSILHELSSDLGRAMCHENATHIFQRAFMVLDADVVRMAVVEKIVRLDMHRVGKHTFGSRALQCVLTECASGKAEMVQDHGKDNGNGRKQRQRGGNKGSTSSSSSSSSSSLTTTSIFSSSSHSAGLSQSKDTSSALELIADAVLDVVPSLAQSAAGNFVLQSILQNGTGEHRVRLVHEATQDLVRFACNKHASHFVERCVAMASDEELSEMVRKLVLGSPATPPTSLPALVGMMNNSFANFVVTTLIGRVASSGCDGASELRSVLTTYEANMRGSKIGERTWTQAMRILDGRR
jgi:hypothetical protein